MTYSAVSTNKLAVNVVAVLVGAMLISAAHAQVTPPPGYPAYPTNTAQMPMAPQPPPPPPQSHMIRELFAGTLAAVLQTATGGLIGAVNGGIMNWFAKKGKGSAQGYAAPGYAPMPAYPAGAAPYPSTSYPGTNAYPPAQAPAYPNSADPAANAYPAAAAPAYPAPESAYPSTGYPSTPYPTEAAYPAAADQAYPSQAGGYPSGTQVYDARTGQTVTGGDNPYTMPASGYDGTLYAGIAYEVHALSTDGRSTPINAATHEFHTGDKFMVYYRPSLPGRMQVYNINPAGQQTLIDATNMAAGQMTGLGPYQFTSLTGDESLRLVLSPCSNPQLLAATRDIVRADAWAQTMPQMAPQTSSGVQLTNCDAPTTRGLEVRTRDIQKVAVDGMTSFALDPVSEQERASGQVTPREATIVFHHR